MVYLKRISIILFVFFILFSVLSAHFQKDGSSNKFIVIGTGGVTGVYYPVGGAIQRLVSRMKNDHPYRVSIESTGATIFNLNALHLKELDLAIVQADLLSHAYNGRGIFKEPYRDLRVVFMLHPEAFTVVAREDSGINQFIDLRGKRVNVGNPGSGQRGTMEVLMKLYGWTFSDFSKAAQLGSGEQAQALCDNHLDAIIFAVGHPNGSIQEASTACKTKLIDVRGALIRELVLAEPYYEWMEIPNALYNTKKKGFVTTFGARAVMISSKDVPNQKVYTITKAVFEHLNDFRRLHPAFADLTAKTMVQTVGSIPFHQGALDYFYEKGYLKPLNAK